MCGAFPYTESEIVLNAVLSVPAHARDMITFMTTICLRIWITPAMYCYFKLCQIRGASRVN